MKLLIFCFLMSMEMLLSAAMGTITVSKPASTAVSLGRSR